MDGWGVMPNIKESQNKVTSCHNLEGGKAASKGKIDGGIKETALGGFAGWKSWKRVEVAQTNKMAIMKEPGLELN